MPKLLILLSIQWFALSLFAQNVATIPGQILVQLKPSERIDPLLMDIHLVDASPSEIRVVRLVSKPLNIWLLSFDPQSARTESILQAFAERQEVLAVQSNHHVSQRQTIPNDTEFNAQWQWLNTGAGGGLEDADVDAELAWDITTGGLTPDGDTIVIAIPDDGTQLTHPDLAPNLWINYHEIPDDGIDNDDNGYIDDYYGWNIHTQNDNVGDGEHGVKVAGMIGARGNNAQGVSGINWHVKLMTIDNNGDTDEADVLSAFTYPLVQRQLYQQTNGAKGAFVVALNTSWGIDYAQAADHPIWCSFFDTLGVYGILSCSATANANVNVDIAGDMPTTCPSPYLLTVTATNNQDQRLNAAYGSINIDVAAPGNSIYTTANAGYGVASGTSFASPVVTGLVGLMYAAPCSNLTSLAKSNPAAAVLLVKSLILGNVDTIQQLINEVHSLGRVNAFKSLTGVLNFCGPCPQPAAMQANNITVNGADITWNLPANATATQLRWRALGSGSWNTVSNVVSPYHIGGLAVCSPYEVQVKTICNSIGSDYNNILVFKTRGCCDPPGNVHLVQATEQNAQIGWDGTDAAIGYVLRYRKSGTLTWTNIDLNSTIQSYVISGLESCTQYEAEISSVCDTGLTPYTSLIFSTKGCGACYESNYCVSSGQTVDYEWINEVLFNTLFNASGQNGGYENFTSFSTDVGKGYPYQITIVPGFGFGAFGEYFRAWIDLNQDGDFEDTGELVFDPGVSNALTTGTITIPANAVAGNTRMRVTLKYANQGSNAAPAPCEQFAEGEVEDYCVNILPGITPSCFTPAALDTILTTNTLAQLKWSPVDFANSYQIRLREIGSGSWMYFHTNNVHFEANGLTPCTGYEYQVKTNCTMDSSNYSNSFEFSTSCFSGTENPEIPENGIQIYPNPFSGSIFINAAFSTIQPLQIQLFDLLGKQIMTVDQVQIQKDKPVEIMDLGSLPGGMYVLTLRFSGKTMAFKLIRN